METDLDMISFGCCKASRTGIAAATLLLSIEVHGGKLVWNGEWWTSSGKMGSDLQTVQVTFNDLQKECSTWTGRERARDS